MNHEGEGEIAEEQDRELQRRVSFKMDLNNNGNPDEGLDRNRKEFPTCTANREYRNGQKKERAISNNGMPPTCTRSRCNNKSDGDVDRQITGKPAGILRASSRVHLSALASVTCSPPAGPVSLFKRSTLLNALKRSNETRGCIEKVKKRILHRLGHDEQQQRCHTNTTASSLPSRDDTEGEESRRRRIICIQSTNAMMAQTLPPTMMPFVEKALKSTLFLRRHLPIGNEHGRVIHRILVDQHKRIVKVAEDDKNGHGHGNGHNHSSSESSES